MFQNSKYFGFRKAVNTLAAYFITHTAGCVAVPGFILRQVQKDHK